MEVRQTDEFAGWLRALADDRAKARIVARFARVEMDLLGDVKCFDGLAEFRIDYGPGYRIYAAERGSALVILLCGGDKGSQKRDIRRAKAMLADLE